MFSAGGQAMYSTGNHPSSPELLILRADELMTQLIHDGEDNYVDRLAHMAIWRSSSGPVGGQHR